MLLVVRETGSGGEALEPCEVPLGVRDPQRVRLPPTSSAGQGWWSRTRRCRRGDAQRIFLYLSEGNLSFVRVWLGMRGESMVPVGRKDEGCSCRRGSS